MVPLVQMGRYFALPLPPRGGALELVLNPEDDKAEEFALGEVANTKAAGERPPTV